MQWGKYSLTSELINIATTINIIGHESLVDDVLKSGVRYYMVMLTNFAIVSQEVEANSSSLAMNTYKFIMKWEVETENFEHTT